MSSFTIKIMAPDEVQQFRTRQRLVRPARRVMNNLISLMTAMIGATLAVTFTGSFTLRITMALVTLALAIIVALPLWLWVRHLENGLYRPNQSEILELTAVRRRHFLELTAYYHLVTRLFHPTDTSYWRALTVYNDGLRALQRDDLGECAKHIEILQNSWLGTFVPADAH